MKKPVVFILLLSLVWGTSCFLSTASAELKQKPCTPPSTLNIYGVVVSIDLEDRRIVTSDLIDPSIEKAFVLDDECLIQNEAGPGALEDFSVGDHVSVSFLYNDEGQEVTVSVFVHPEDSGDGRPLSPEIDRSD